ncbi:MAG: DUF4360 domain-containing protein [Oligoflexus sp.]
MTMQRFSIAILLACYFFSSACQPAKHAANNATTANFGDTDNPPQNSDQEPNLDECQPGDLRDYRQKNFVDSLRSAKNDDPAQSDDPSQSDDEDDDQADIPDDEQADEDDKDPIPCVDRPGDTQVNIKNVSFAGSACGPGTVSLNLSDDLQAFTLIFNDFVAEAGPGIDPSLARVNCIIDIELEQKAMWSFALIKADFRGFVDLEEGLTASLRGQYSFPDGSTGAISFAEEFAGAITENFSSTQTIDERELLWSPCASNQVQLTSEAIIDAQIAEDSFGVLAVDSLDGELVQSFTLRWKPCQG